MALLFLRASRGKEFESDPFIGSKLGLNGNLCHHRLRDHWRGACILNIQNNHQSIMSNAEVITFAIVTARFFSGNYKMARITRLK